MNDYTIVRMEVLDISLAAGLVLVAVYLIIGDVKEAMLIETEDTNERWEIKGIAFVSAEAWRSGRRGLSLQPVDEGATLRPGQILRSLREPIVTKEELSDL